MNPPLCIALPRFRYFLQPIARRIKCWEIYQIHSYSRVYIIVLTYSVLEKLLGQGV